jgi:hypothetical protein
MKIEIEYEYPCLRAKGGSGRLIVRAPWLSPAADMIDPSLRHRRDRRRELALQEPRLAFPNFSAWYHDP